MVMPRKLPYGRVYIMLFGITVVSTIGYHWISYKLDLRRNTKFQAVHRDIAMKNPPAPNLNATTSGTTTGNKTDSKNIENGRHGKRLVSKSDKGTAIVVDEGNLQEEEREDNIRYLTEAGKAIREALLHAQGSKTRKFLQESLSDVGKALMLLNVDLSAAISRKSGRSGHICPEAFVNSEYVLSSCAYGEPVHNLLSVVILDVFIDDCNSLNSLIKSIKEFNSELSVVLGVKRCIDIESKLMTEHKRKVDFFLYDGSKTVGFIMNDLINQVSTDFALIGRDITHFNKDIRLERMIREMESHNTPVVGGSLRDVSGHWTIGCHQAAHRNYRLVYSEGYVESYNDCVFCDYMEGPFVMRTEKTQLVRFDNELQLTGLFEDYFLRMRYDNEVILCPDSMFQVKGQIRDGNVNKWDVFSEKFNVDRIKLVPPVPEIVLDCGTVQECEKERGHIVSRCCLANLTTLINDIMKVCEEAELHCELCEGTLLAAVKFNDVFPWSRTANIRLYHPEFFEFGTLTAHFRKMNYVLINRQDAEGVTFVRGYQQGIYKVCSRLWCVEVSTMPMTDTIEMQREHLTPTKIKFGGRYVTASRNPALASRNRYAPEIFRHAEHHSALRMYSWGQYPAGNFTDCDEAGKHSCLDNYNADGNLQFLQTFVAT